MRLSRNTLFIFTRRFITYKKIIVTNTNNLKSGDTGFQLDDFNNIIFFTEAYIRLSVLTFNSL